MNEQFPDRNSMLEIAARLAEGSGLTVLDRDCTAGGHRVDLVAVTGSGTLAVIEVTVAPPDTAPAAAARLTAARVLELDHAAKAWECAHPGEYGGLRIYCAVLWPDGSGEVARWQSGSAR